MQLYKAQYIYPVSSPPISDGIIAIDGERIAAVGLAAAITQQYPCAHITDLGQVMLMPQAVNTHTHLELTMLAEMGQQHIADRSFTQWIVELVKAWRTIPASTQAEGARDGCCMLIDSGTAAVGDISNTHNSLEPLLESGLYGIIYHEVLSPDPANAASLLQKAQERIQRWHSEYGEQRIRLGVTLHTPFTVSPETFRAFVPWVIEEQVPLCIHAAESPAEVEYLMFGTGDIVNAMFAASASFREWIPVPHPSAISINWVC
jgi:cytosine/adenosine deaminase-related metal-dependent hydrolase